MERSACSRGRLTERNYDAEKIFSYHGSHDGSEKFLPVPPPRFGLQSPRGLRSEVGKNLIRKNGRGDG